ASPGGAGVLGHSAGSAGGSRRRRGPGTRGSFSGAGRGDQRRPSATRRWCGGDPSLALDLARWGRRESGADGIVASPVGIDQPRPEPGSPGADELFHRGVHVGGFDVRDEGEFGAVFVKRPEHEAGRRLAVPEEMRIEHGCRRAGGIFERLLEMGQPSLSPCHSEPHSRCGLPSRSSALHDEADDGDEAQIGDERHAAFGAVAVVGAGIAHLQDATLERVIVEADAAAEAREDHAELWSWGMRPCSIAAATASMTASAWSNLSGTPGKRRQAATQTAFFRATLSVVSGRPTSFRQRCGWTTANGIALATKSAVQSPSPYPVVKMEARPCPGLAPCPSK